MPMVGVRIRTRVHSCRIGQSPSLSATDTGLLLRVLYPAGLGVVARVSERARALLTPDRPCNIRREGGQPLVIGGSSLVILEGKACNPL